MSTTIDLDINNYTIKDIEKLFDIKPYIDYTPSDIELKEKTIREQLLQSEKVNKKFTKELIDFTNKAKNWLILLKCKKNNNPTTLSNINVDNTKYIQDQTLSRENELVIKPGVKYVNVYNSEFVSGKLNPLNNTYITKCLAIDTKFRDNYYSTKCSDFILQLPTTINKVVSMQLAAIEFPTIFYSISEAIGNNYIYVEIGMVVTDNNNSGLTYFAKTVVIPDGNYTGADLITIINTFLSPKIPNSTDPVDINDKFNWIEFLLDISPSGSGTAKTVVQISKLGEIYKAYYNLHSIRIDARKNKDGVIQENTDITTRLPYLLGFTKPVNQDMIHSELVIGDEFSYEQGKSTSNRVLLMSDSLCQILKTTYVYLSINDYTNNYNQFITAFNKAPMDPNILARISFRGHSYYNLVSNDDMVLVTQPRKYFGPIDIKTLHIRLYDEYGKIIDMNNGDFSFCLNLKILYDL